MSILKKKKKEKEKEKRNKRKKKKLTQREGDQGIQHQ